MYYIETYRKDRCTICGVFGFVTKNGNGPDLRALEKIAVATEKRGPHAFGFAWIDSKDRLKMYKHSGRISNYLGLLAMARDAKFLIGHCRWATQGDPANNLNNHPFACDGGWIVHNGVISDYDRLLHRFDLHPVSECDSEVLAMLIERSSCNTLIERCEDAVLSVAESPLVLLGLWKPGVVVAARQGNPLHIGATRQGTYLASLSTDLPGRVREFVNREIVTYGD